MLGLLCSCPLINPTYFLKVKVYKNRHFKGLAVACCKSIENASFTTRLAGCPTLRKGRDGRACSLNSCANEVPSIAILTAKFRYFARSVCRPGGMMRLGTRVVILPIIPSIRGDGMPM